MSLFFDTHPVHSREPRERLRQLPEAVHRVDVGRADPLVAEERVVVELDALDGVEGGPDVIIFSIIFPIFCFSKKNKKRRARR